MVASADGAARDCARDTARCISSRGTLRSVSSCAKTSVRPSSRGLSPRGSVEPATEDTLFQSRLQKQNFYRIAEEGKTKVGLLLIILALVVVVLGLTWVAVSWEGNSQTTTSPPASSQTTPTPTANQRVGQVQRTTLTDPSSQDILGEMAKESISAGDQRFKVTVRLPAPGEGNFYAVWLTQMGGTETKYLGKLSQSGADYVLEYQSSEDVQNFDKIVVTSGAVADTKIETIVAEGTIASQLLL